jgi:hypothetical protein
MLAGNSSAFDRTFWPGGGSGRRALVSVLRTGMRLPASCNKHTERARAALRGSISEPQPASAFRILICPLLLRMEAGNVPATWYLGVSTRLLYLCRF